MNNFYRRIELKAKFNGNTTVKEQTQEIFFKQNHPKKVGLEK